MHCHMITQMRGATFRLLLSAWERCMRRPNLIPLPYAATGACTLLKMDAG